MKRFNHSSSPRGGNRCIVKELVDSWKLIKEKCFAGFLFYFVDFCALFLGGKVRV